MWLSVCRECEWAWGGGYTCVTLPELWLQSYLFNINWNTFHLFKLYDGLYRTVLVSGHFLFLLFFCFFFGGGLFVFVFNGRATFFLMVAYESFMPRIEFASKCNFKQGRGGETNEEVSHINTLEWQCSKKEEEQVQVSRGTGEEQKGEQCDWTRSEARLGDHRGGGRECGWCRMF